MKLLKTILLATSLASVLPQMAAAKPSMRDIPEIENTLFAAALGHEVSEKCPTIKARRMKAMGIALRLRARANELGYSDAEIRAYLKSDTEKARMRAKGEAYLKANGVDYNKIESFCVFGHAEIAKSSAVGALLRAK